MIKYQHLILIQVSPLPAQAEANKLNHKTVTLTENYPYEYVSKTAAQDAAAIKQVLG